MVSLNYYHPWYRSAPSLHKSIGVLVLFGVLVRIAWHLFSPPPAPLSQQRSLRIIAQVTHKVLYLCILGITLSGYLISTAKGQPISIFGLWQLPAWPAWNWPQQEGIAGLWHQRLAWLTISLAGLHGLAALKHHWIDKDATLMRMLGRADR